MILDAPRWVTILNSFNIPCVSLLDLLNANLEVEIFRKVNNIKDLLFCHGIFFQNRRRDLFIARGGHVVARFILSIVFDTFDRFAPRGRGPPYNGLYGKAPSERVPLSRLKYSLTSPYGHLYNTDTSLLRTVWLVPEMPKIIHCLPL